ncbi:MAG: hypothetical protein JSV51_00890 [Candidatus Bathyarchaeota archaeon]|nr:MAG: hypothetical protein JSV51_00890 [Candidatus Bathyarchaeota archaeon]
MKKKVFVIAIIVLISLGMLASICLLKPTQAACPLGMETTCLGTIDKEPDEFFEIKITFRNNGERKGTWEIAVTFEGDDWTWKGEKKLLVLNPGKKKTLRWEGEVPEVAAADSIARLIVYYDNMFVAMNWWIHVTDEAELCIVDSEVS